MNLKLDDILSKVDRVEITINPGSGSYNMFKNGEVWIKARSAEDLDLLIDKAWKFICLKEDSSSV